MSVCSLLRTASAPSRPWTSFHFGDRAPGVQQRTSVHGIHSLQGGCQCCPISTAAISSPSTVADRVKCVGLNVGRPKNAHHLQAFIVVVFQNTPLGAECNLRSGTGVEPVTARLNVWCSTSELTTLEIALIKTHVRNTPRNS